MLFDSLLRCSPHRDSSHSRADGSLSSSSHLELIAPAVADPCHLLPEEPRESPSRLATTGGAGVVFDGMQPQLIFFYNVTEGKIDQFRCSGDIPEPREGHACCVSGALLLLVGGCLTDARSWGQDGAAFFFTLDLTTLIWSQHRFGSVGAPWVLTVPRWGHTLTLCDGGRRAVLFGGRTSAQTAADVRVAVDRGFFRTLCFFDFESLTWSTVTTGSLPGHGSPPPVFAHSASLLGTRHLAVFGGMAFETEDEGNVGGRSASYDPRAPPAVSVTSGFFICDLEHGKWTASQTTSAGSEATGAPSRYYIPGVSSPAPRMGHRAVCAGSLLFIVGGFWVDMRGEAHSRCDCWCFDAHMGTWAKMEFCVPEWGRTPFLFVRPPPHPSREGEATVASAQLVAVVRDVFAYTLLLNTRTIAVSEYPSPYRRRGEEGSGEAGSGRPIPIVPLREASARNGAAPFYLTAQWEMPAHALIVHHNALSCSSLPREPQELPPGGPSSDRWEESMVEADGAEPCVHDDDPVVAAFADEGSSAAWEAMKYWGAFNSRRQAGLEGRLLDMLGPLSADEAIALLPSMAINHL